MRKDITLVSHHLCPYAQRAAISLREKGAAFERIDVNLADKPDWFVARSPLGKVPMLMIGSHTIFESAVILEFLEETLPHPLHPGTPLERARHRSWIEFGSALLNKIANLYNAGDRDAFNSARDDIAVKWQRVEAQLGDGPWFSGSNFSLVDASFAPIFRYFDTLEETAEFNFFADAPKVSAWRHRLAARPSVHHAVAPDYPQRLTEFLSARGSHLSSLMV